jgi:curved DNA-binding protein
VAPTATDEEIKKAFRTLARKYHPDVAKDKRTAEEKFKEINEANEVLSHPESRRKFDELGANWKAEAQSRPPPGRAGSRTAGRGTSGPEDEFQFEGTGFSDFFEQFFGGRAGRSRGASPFGPSGFGNDDRGAAPALRGQDIQGDILITLDEVLQGARRAISVRRTNARSGVEETATYQVRIPKGVRAGQSIRVPGKGGEGMGGATAGDIYLRVRYAQHPDWQVRGADLVGHLELAPWEAVLGATVPVKTLEGNVSVKVPAGFQAGQQLRVRGQGLPEGAAKRGDIYVGVSIQTPPHIGKEEERLWRQLAAASTFNPRKSI